MKFLTFTDLHDDQDTLRQLVKRAKEDDIDFLICCGDISRFGRGLKDVLHGFDKVGKTIYVIPGNHEDGTPFEAMVNKTKHWKSFDRKDLKLGNYILLGYGSGGFALEDKEFRKLARSWYGKHKDKKIIFVSHGPPYGTQLDLLPEGHVGNKDYTKFIRRIQPKLAISGHLHETVGIIQKIDGIKLINPGWEGMVVELP